MSDRDLLCLVVCESLVERVLEGRACTFAVKAGGVPVHSGLVRAELRRRGVSFKEWTVPRGIQFNVGRASIVVRTLGPAEVVGENTVDERLFRV